MHIFLIAQARYQNFEVSLFNGLSCIDQAKHDKKDTSKDLIPTIHNLLIKNSISLQEISAIGVNQGPGPFTTLRIILTTVNGIAFATTIPLIGCNSLEALLEENQDSSYPTTVALLDACSNDVYYALQHKNNPIIYGCSKITELLLMLKKELQDFPIRFIGNGVLIAQQEIKNIFGPDAYIQEPLAQEASLNQIATMTYHSFVEKQGLSTQLLPIYLKDVHYKTTPLR